VSDRPPMTPLILVPGFACDAALWAAQLPALGPAAECMIADHGRLDSIPAMADAVLKAAPPRFALAGHSMGARVAIEIVRRAPERVERLAILDSNYRPRPPGAAGEKERSDRLGLLELARARGMRAMAEYWAPPLVHPDRLRDRKLMGELYAMVERRTPLVLAAQMKALLDRPDATQALRGIRVPTLVLCGRDDSWSGLARHQEMAAIIPGARLVVLERCGHMSTMERPDEVNAALAAWLGQH
jgi:pimeloyl-ACP methyl ester carboxylesterase